MDEKAKASKRSRTGKSHGTSKSRAEKKEEPRKRRRREKEPAKVEPPPEDKESDDEEEVAMDPNSYNPYAGDYGVTVEQGLAEWFCNSVRKGNRAPMPDKVDVVPTKPQKKVAIAKLEDLPARSREHIARLKPLRIKQREIAAKYRGPRTKYSKARRHHLQAAVSGFQRGNKDATMFPFNANKKNYIAEVVNGTRTKKLTAKLLQEKLPGWIAVYLKEMLPHMVGRPFNETVFKELDKAHRRNIGDLVKLNLEEMYHSGEMDDPFTDLRIVMT